MDAFCPDETMLRHYIQCKLSPAEEEQVEIWLLNNPEMVENLKLDLAFYQCTEPPLKTANRIQGFNLFRPIPAMVFSALIGFGLANLTLTTQHGSDEAYIQANIRIVDISTTRSISSNQFHLTLKPEESYIVIKILGESVATLLNAELTKNNKPVFSDGSLITKDEGDVFFGIPTNLLEPGNYYLKITTKPNNNLWFEKNITIDY